MRSLILLLSTPCAIATAAPMRGEYLAADTVHIANGGGAINTRLGYEVTLTVAGTKATLVERGESHEHNLFTNFSTDDDITWAATWTGTAKSAASKLLLELAQSSGSCRHVRKSSGAADESKVCDKAATKTIKLECTSDTIKLAQRGNPPRPIWRCNLAAGELPYAPPIIVGKTECVSVGGSRRSLDLRYEACKS